MKICIETMQDIKSRFYPNNRVKVLCDVGKQKSAQNHQRTSPHGFNQN